MIAGASVDKHHWVPRTEGGCAASHLHRICHRMVHRVFTEKELAVAYSDPEAIRDHPEIQRFVAWVRRKPPEYVDWPKAAKTKKHR